MFDGCSRVHRFLRVSCVIVSFGDMPLCACSTTCICSSIITCFSCPISQHRSSMQHSASTSRRMFTAAHCSSMNPILPHHRLITLSMHSESSLTHLRPPILRPVDVSTAGRSLLQACAPAAALLVGHFFATHPYQAALQVFSTWEHVLSIQHPWTAPFTHPCTIRMYKPSWTSGRVPCAT